MAIQRQYRKNSNRRRNGAEPAYKSAEDWLQAAKEFLSREGIAGVKVEPIARSLGVTPGSFYWHYQNRQELHKALLRHWLQTNVDPFHRAFEYTNTPRDQYLAMMYVWLLSPEFDPVFDVAVREWSRTSALVERVVRIVDNNRIGLYQQLFGSMGFSETSAMVRGRTFYYHQIGYYAMRIKDDMDLRLELLPYYAELFMDDGWLTDANDADSVRDLLLSYKSRVDRR